MADGSVVMAAFSSKETVEIVYEHIRQCTKRGIERRYELAVEFVVRSSSFWRF
jgi:hypothetical protein